MTAITVPLHCVGPDRFEGELEPAGVTVHLHVHPDGVRLALWMPHGFGRNPCGHGSLTHSGGAWSGTAEDTVAKRRWRVSGDCEGGELMFEKVGK